MNIIRLNSIGEPFAKSGQATPPSGGGTESSWRYLDVTNVSKTMLKSYLIGYADTLVVAQGGQTHIVSPFAVVGASEDVEIKAMSVNMRTRIKNSATSFVLMAYEDIFKQEEGGVPGWDIIFTNNGATEITEEQFYTL